MWVFKFPICLDPALACSGLCLIQFLLDLVLACARSSSDSIRLLRAQILSRSGWCSFRFG